MKELAIGEEEGVDGGGAAAFHVCCWLNQPLWKRAACRKAAAVAAWAAAVSDDTMYDNDKLEAKTLATTRTTMYGNSKHKEDKVEEVIEGKVV